MSDEEDVDFASAQASFVIPCSTSSKGKERRIENAFPVLFPFEEDARASQHRKRAFDQSIAGVQAALGRVYQALYGPILAQLKSEFDQATTLNSSQSRQLKLFAFVGISPSTVLIEQVRETVLQDGTDRHWVHVHPRECPDLTTILRLVTARALGSNLGLVERNDLNDPYSLLQLGSKATVCVFVDGLATFHYSVLNDFVQAIQSLSEEADAPRFVLFAMAEGGTSTLDDKLEPMTLPSLEVTPLVLPPLTHSFEELIAQLFLAAGEQQNVWLSHTTLAMLRRQYYESWPDLDQVQAIIEADLHHHFSRRPLSILASSSLLDTDVLTASFFARVRSGILDARSSTDLQENVPLPVPMPDKDGRQHDKQTHMTLLLKDERYLLDQVQSFQLAVQRRRASFVTAVRLVHHLRSAFGLNASSDPAASGAQPLYIEPRRNQPGGLFYAMLEASSARSILQDIRTTIRSRTLSMLEDVLQHIRHAKYLADSPHEDELTGLYERVSDLALSDGEEHEGDENDDARIARVQSRLLREESSTKLKREMGEWLYRVLRSLTFSQAPLEEEAWTTSKQADYLLSLIQPAPRVSILAALNDPKAYYGEAQAMADVPDVCRAYQTYQDAGRMVNLADWFTAFSHSIGKTTVGFSASNGKRKRRRDRDEDDASSDSEESSDGQQDGSEVNRRQARQDKDSALWNQGGQVQARFALAVHELGRMGFLKRTRRKADHVLKLVYDLPPRKPSSSRDVRQTREP